VPGSVRWRPLHGALPPAQLRVELLTFAALLLMFRAAEAALQTTRFVISCSPSVGRARPANVAARMARAAEHALLWRQSPPRVRAGQPVPAGGSRILDVVLRSMVQISTSSACWPPVRRRPRRQAPVLPSTPPDRPSAESQDTVAPPARKIAPSDTQGAALHHVRHVACDRQGSGSYAGRQKGLAEKVWTRPARLCRSEERYILNVFKLS
jgi:hypothetical protein